MIWDLEILLHLLSPRIVACYRPRSCFIRIYFPNVHLFLIYQPHSSTMAEYRWPPSVLSKETALHEEAQFKICTTCMLAQASVNTPRTAMSCDIKFNGQEVKPCWYCYCHGNKNNCNMVSNTALFNLAHFYCILSVLMTPGTSRAHLQVQLRQAAP